MNQGQRLLRRRQLDRQLQTLKGLLPSTPETGWVRTVREALGMSLAAFGRRLGIAQSTAHQIEQAEISGSITLNRLRAAADALGCDVSVVLIPRKPLAEAVEDRAFELARERIGRVGHTMALESQGVSDAVLQEMIGNMAREIVERGDARLWE